MMELAPPPPQISGFFRTAEISQNSHTAATLNTDTQKAKIGENVQFREAVLHLQFA